MTSTFDPVRTADGYSLAKWRVGDGPGRVVVPNGACYVSDLADLWVGQSALVYDLRNRGASETIAAAAVLGGGVRHDLADLEVVRRAAGLERFDLIAHSYVAEVALLYALAHPDRVGRLVAIAPSGYAVGHGGPPPPDTVAVDVFARIAEFMRTPGQVNDEARCRAAWEILAPLYVADPAHAPRIRAWGRCEHANERAFLAYWMRHVEPSLRGASVTATDLAQVTCPVLIVHGDRDRSAPYAAGRAWAERLPNARLLTVPGVAHAPWIESADLVVPAIGRFLEGHWPDGVR